MNLHLAPSLGILEVAVFEDEKLPGVVGGGGTVDAWHTRDLNTVRVASGSSITLNPATSVITLSPGIYFIEGSAPAYFVNSHQVRLQNTSAGSTALLGTSEWTQNAGSQVQTRSFIRGYVRVIGLAENFEVQHYIQASTGGSSLGLPSSAAGTPAIYTTVSITRLR